MTTQTVYHVYSSELEGYRAMEFETREQAAEYIQEFRRTEYGPQRERLMIIEDKKNDKKTEG